MLRFLSSSRACKVYELLVSGIPLLVLDRLWLSLATMARDWDEGYSPRRSSGV